MKKHVLINAALIAGTLAASAGVNTSEQYF